MARLRPRARVPGLVAWFTCSEVRTDDLPLGDRSHSSTIGPKSMAGGRRPSFGRRRVGGRFFREEETGWWESTGRLSADRGTGGHVVL